MTPETSSPWNWVNLIPVTAVVAIVVFIVREVLESRRRAKSKRRQLRAMKLILSRECERNYWPLGTLKEIFDFIEKDPQNYKRVRIVERAMGPGVHIEEDDGKTYGYRIPEFSRGRMSGMLLQVAELDDKMFELVEGAYDAIGEADNARNQLVRIDDMVRETGISELMRGLAGYGLERTSEADAALQALYRHCTGKNLERGRLRG